MFATTATEIEISWCNDGGVEVVKAIDNAGARVSGFGIGVRI